MAHVTYEIVEHNDGWTYKVGDVFAETYPTRDAAEGAAAEAAARQEQEGTDETISYQDASGDWHEETARGDARPDTDVT